MTNVVADNGTVLDATFSIEQSPLSLVYESAGGKTGINARNRDYRAGLDVLLGRLAKIGAVVNEIRVDSLVTRRLPPEAQLIRMSRHRMPLVLSQVNDLDDLRRDISTAAREPGSREGASRGGSSRRLRFILEAAGIAGPDLERTVAGGGAIPEAEVVETVVEIAAGRPRGRSQGFLLDPAVKLAVERHAMELAIDHYSREWTVTDVHANHPYDLECRRGEEVLYVEVKGTTSGGMAVIVTPNEVSHAQAYHPSTELFVVANIGVDGDDAVPPRPIAHGGTQHRYRGWAADPSRLRPVGFEYRLGSGDGDATDGA